jgi:hypothetical protein
MTIDRLYRYNRNVTGVIQIISRSSSFSGQFSSFFIHFRKTFLRGRQCPTVHAFDFAAFMHATVGDSTPSGVSSEPLPDPLQSPAPPGSALTEGFRTSALISLIAIIGIAFLALTVFAIVIGRKKWQRDKRRKEEGVAKQLENDVSPV